MKQINKKPQILLSGFFILLCILIVLPFWMLVSVSLSNEQDIIETGYRFIPKNWDLSAYRFVFKNPGQILSAYKVTFLFSLLGMIGAVIMMSLVAYPLSRKQFRYKGVISFYLYFTMLFNGGMVASYIINTQYYHLGNTLWIYILPILVNPWHVFMIRTFFKGVPEEIIESAYMDGASEFRIFAQMILPLSKPCLATIALLTFLSQWNNWFTSMLYIDDESLISLQYLLQRILQNLQLIQEQSMGVSDTFVSISDIPAETTRMAMSVVVAGPALLIFPFFQKYFVKGLTVGSVKG